MQNTTQNQSVKRQGNMPTALLWKTAVPDSCLALWEERPYNQPQNMVRTEGGTAAGRSTQAKAKTVPEQGNSSSRFCFRKHS
jgi:hypothetical protein